MCPQQIGGIAVRAEVWRTDARDTTRVQDEAIDRQAKCGVRVRQITLPSTVTAQEFRLRR